MHNRRLKGHNGYSAQSGLLRLFLLSILLTLGLSDELSAAWSTTDFHVIVENSVPGDDPELIEARKLANAAWAREVERDLKQIATIYSNAGFLEPILLERTSDGRFKVRVYEIGPDWLGDRRSGFHTVSCYGSPEEMHIDTELASFDVPPPGKRPNGSDRTSEDVEDHRELRRMEFYDTLAHELFHSVQSAYRIEHGFVGECQGRVLSSRNQSVVEGSATAVASLVTDARFANYIRDTRSPTVQGRWDYTRPFLAIVDKSPSYLTSSFWRFLMERYGGLAVMDHLMRIPIPDSLMSSTQDVVDWLDRGVRSYRRINMPLYLLFPEFAAELGTWANHQYMHASLNEWRKDTLGVKTLEAGCPRAELTPSEPAKTFRLELRGLTALCFSVKVSGLGPDQQARVQFMANHAEMEALDALHLGVSTTGYMVSIDKEYDCFTDGRDQARPGVPACLDKPFLGRRDPGKGPVLNCAAARTSAEKSVCQKAPTQADGSQYVKTWLGDTQRPGTGAGIFVNYYVFSNVDPVPKASGSHAYEMQVAIELAESSSTESGPGKNPVVGVNAAFNEAAGPMTESSRLNPSNAMGMEALTQMAFLQSSMTQSYNEALREGVGNGLVSVNVTDQDADNLDESEISGANHFQIYFEGGSVPFGFEGKIKAYLGQGMTFGSNDPMDMIIAANRDRPTGTATIRRFDDELLEMEIESTYCRFRNTNLKTGRCRKKETLKASFTKPFGWMYDVGQQFTSIDSPGMREYRRAMGTALSGANSGLPISPPDQSSSVAGSASGSTGSGNGSDGDGDSGSTPSPASAPSCACTCEEAVEVEDLVERLDAADAAGEPVDHIDASKMRCMMPCMASYAMCSMR